MARDHVATAAPIELAYVDAGHAVPVAGNAEHGGGGHAGRRQGVAAGVGLEPRVGGAPHKFHVKFC
ncbi:hypothetical protein D3C72_1203510 [compost metagenome]